MSRLAMPGRRDVACAGATGLLIGVGLGVLLVIESSILPALFAVVAGALLSLIIMRFPSVDDRWWLGRLLALAYALRICVIAILHAWSMAHGQGGLITGDDHAYANLSWSFVQYLRGSPQDPYVPPTWGGDAYLFGTWVYLEAAIFALVGYLVEVPEILNAAFAIIGVLLVYDIAKLLFYRSAARSSAALVAFFPSLVLWSSLNLKDSLALMLLLAVLGAVCRYSREGSLKTMAAAFGLLLPIESLRNYLFVGLDLLIPVGALLANRLTSTARMRGIGVSLVLAVALLGAQRSGATLGPDLLAQFQYTREQMAIGARTGFVTPPPLALREGDTFTVPGSTSPSASPPQVVHVPSDARLVVLAGGQTAPPSPSPGTLFVRPGDVVVVGPAASSPQTDQLVVGTIDHLPVGIAYALGAPFPWAVSRTLDLATVPEMLLWYVVLVATAITIWRERRRWRDLAVPVLYAAGVLLLLALVEGNVGTLFRHRGMVIPVVIILASPTLSLLARRYHFD